MEFEKDYLFQVSDWARNLGLREGHDLPRGGGVAQAGAEHTTHTQVVWQGLREPGDCWPVFMNVLGDLDLCSLGPSFLISEIGVGPDEGQGPSHSSFPVTVGQSSSHTSLWRVVISLVSLPGPRQALFAQL